MDRVGTCPLPACTLPIMGRPRHPGTLTPAEQRVLAYLRLGETNTQIAVHLGLSVNTVRYHVANTLEKLGPDDRRAVAAWDAPSAEGHQRAWAIAAGVVVGVTLLAVAAALFAPWRHDSADTATTLPQGTLAYISVEPGTRSAELHLLHAGEVEPARLYAPLGPQMLFSPVWSPDGTRIALITVDSAKLPVTPGESSVGHVLMVYAASGHATLLSRGDDYDVSIAPAAAAVEYPAWRPDGGAVAFVTQDFITTVRPLNEDHASDQMMGCVSPRWSPRRGGACVVPDNADHLDISEGGYNELFRPELPYEARPGIPASGTAPRSFATHGKIAAYPAFSADGRWLAWVEREGDASSVAVSPPGAPMVDPANEVAGYRRTEQVEAGPGRRPEWAPRGLWLAFSDGLPAWFLELLGGGPGADTAGEIRLFNAERMKRRTIASSPANDCFPAWSPDGRWIAFVSDRDDPLGEIYVVRADGSGLRRVTYNDRAEAQPAWRPE